jgi:hypothetical protein
VGTGIESGRTQRMLASFAWVGLPAPIYASTRSRTRMSTYEFTFALAVFTEPNRGHPNTETQMNLNPRLAQMMRLIEADEIAQEAIEGVDGLFLEVAMRDALGITEDREGFADALKVYQEQFRERCVDLAAIVPEYMEVAAPLAE